MVEKCHIFLSDSQEKLERKNINNNYVGKQTNSAYNFLVFLETGSINHTEMKNQKILKNKSRKVLKVVHNSKKNCDELLRDNNEVSVY